MRPAHGLVALVAVACLAACGGDQDPAAPKASATPTAEPTASGVPEGRPVPEVLSRLRCERGEDDVWRASGTVRNPTKEPVAYQVTVQVGAPGGASPAATQPVGTVRPGDSATFLVDEVPVGGDEGPCHVQVLALR